MDELFVQFVQAEASRSNCDHALHCDDQQFVFNVGICGLGIKCNLQVFWICWLLSVVLCVLVSLSLLFFSPLLVSLCHGCLVLACSCTLKLLGMLGNFCAIFDLHFEMMLTFDLFSSLLLIFFNYYIFLFYFLLYSEIPQTPCNGILKKN